MKKLLIFLIIPLLSLGQGWEQTFSFESRALGKSVQQTSDGGFIITGFTRTSEGDVDLLLIKTDENGQEDWVQTFGGSGDSFGSSVLQTNDGGYIVTGTTASFNGNWYGDYDYPPEIPYSSMYLLKTNENGEEEWSRTLGGVYDDDGYSVKQTPDGGYIISGAISTGMESGATPFQPDYPSSLYSDSYVVKTNQSGYEEWSHTYGSNEADAGHSVDLTNDGGYIVAGEESDEVSLIKFDQSGSVVWSELYTFGNSDWDDGYSVKQTSDGGYVVTGRTSNSTNGGFLLKVNQNGVQEWWQFYESDPNCGWKVLNCVKQTLDGGYIMSGYECQNALLIKTNELGQIQWSQSFNISESSVPQSKFYSVSQTLDGGYVTVGFTNVSPWSVFLVKTDSYGNVTTTSTIEIPSFILKSELVNKTNILGGKSSNNNGFHLYIYDDGSVEKRYLIK